MKTWEWLVGIGLAIVIALGGWALFILMVVWLLRWLEVL